MGDYVHLEKHAGHVTKHLCLRKAKVANDD